MQKRVQRNLRADRIAVRRRATQQGSALLIVLVFAAIVAIMLYRELPVVAFEAQRQREALTVSRGNSYKRAVKLFVRKVGRFPSTLDELENTNRMRFLPHRYVDPLTGKDDWRLIHAGPGGIITDSKIPGNKSPTSTLGQAATFAGFNNSFTGDAEGAAEAAAANAANPGLRQRAAATKNAASVQQTSDGLGLPPGSQDPNAPPSSDDPNSMANRLQSGFMQPQGTGLAPANGNQIDPATGLSTNAVAAATGNGINTFSQQLNNTNPQTQQLSPQQAGQQNQANQQNGLTNTASFGGTPSGVPQQPVGNGQIGGTGGIAGVASKALGKGIKSVNDQTKYDLWEFYYDLRKEQQGAAGGLPANGVNANNNQNGNGVNSNNSAFGSNSNNGSMSGFGGSSSFGQNPSQQGFPPTTPAPPAQLSNPPQQQ